jgi:5-methyltetrahydropteroyltriglutamate--homocysteine methyltransferase
VSKSLRRLASGETAEEGRAATGDDEGKIYVCTGPITYEGTELRRDIDNLKAALEGVEVEDAFLTAVSPASLYWLQNEHYASEDELVFALADALREEYRGIVDAGFTLQVDDAVMIHKYETILMLGGTVEDYRAWADLRVEAVNQALAGIPEDRVRYHVCCGSGLDAHTFDTPLREVIDVVLRVNAGAYSFEQANVRHEHEWQLWEDVKLPEGKVLIPGFVTHKTPVVEHPELVAQRIIRMARIVGPERVIAGADCGFAQGAFTRRVPLYTQWAKLEALVEGARLATEQLFGSKAPA